MSNNTYPIQVVKELRGGGLLYPKNIPADRGSTALILQIILAISLWAVCVYLAMRNRELIDAVKYSWYCLASNILVIVTFSYLLRICYLVEDFQHLQSRYNGSIAEVLKAALKCNTITIIVTVVCVALFVGMILDVGSPSSYLLSFSPEPYVFSLISSLLITHLINVNESRLDTSLKLSEIKGMDYGSGMAYSYYYGYLNIVLPARGDESKGLLENIKLYEATHGVTIPVKKIFILIPNSLRIPPDLKEASNNWLEMVSALESVVKTRAGTKERTYHNTIYRIHPGGRDKKNEPVYVITEGATPLLTFFEVLEHSGKDSTSYNEYKIDIAGSFYRTLRHIIRSKPEVRDLCELVYYEDLDPEQRVVNVGKIIYDRITELASLD